MNMSMNVKEEFEKSIGNMKSTIKQYISYLENVHSNNSIAAREYLKMAYQHLDRAVNKTD